MIPVREVAPGVFERIAGNPVLLRLDGKAKAPLRVLMLPSWSDEERAAYGIRLAEPFKVPQGKRAVGKPTYEMRSGKVVEVQAVDDIPTPEPDTRTPQQKVEAMAERFGLTVDELRAVLIEGGRQ